MRLSEDRISHLSHLILDGVLRPGVADALQPNEKVLREIKRTFASELQFLDEADTAARDMIRSLSRRVPEGSAEWDVLYLKYLEQETRRRKRL